MPDLIPTKLRMECRGLDISNVVDRIPPGYFPYLSNTRVLQEGRIDSRPGYTPFSLQLSTALLHSIRRLNDVDMAFAPAGYTYIVGDGTELWAGAESALAKIDGGYSGAPLSLITFRPENSPVAWMYVYDALKQVKVRPDGALRPIGVAPPSKGPSVEYGAPAMATITDGATATGWVASGTASSPTTADRPNSSAPTISVIIYNNGPTGWCVLSPNLNGQSFWTGERMRVVLNTGGGTAETAVVREIHPAIGTTTVAAIQYDLGSFGPCTIVITGNPSGLARNSIIQVGTEYVRVLSVTPSPDGTTYSIRCNCAALHTAGSAIHGAVSWYVYTVNGHSTGETITLKYVAVSDSSSGTGQAGLLSNINAASAAGRPISISDDYLHISLFLQNPQNITSINLMIDIDPGTSSLGAAFASNFWTWTITPAQLNLYGPGNVVGDSWTEILIPISSGQRSGNDRTLDFSGIKAIQVQLVTTGACAFGFDCWYFLGTYGPFVPPNSPVGLLYETVYRDSSTGAASVPSPPSRYEVFPLREAIVVAPTETTAPGVDSIDVYRQGNTLTNFVYVGTVSNFIATPQLIDDQPDSSLLSNPSPDLTLIQPWPVLDIAWSGFVNVVGTSVTWVSGTKFDLNLLSGTVITISGVAYQVRGQPVSSTFLELFLSGGVQTNVPFSVASPTLAAQPLPFAFGPLEGPFSPVVLALGDARNAGTLYYSNAANADAASDQNTLELCPPSEPLISGDVWNGLAFAGSRENLYLIRYSYLATIGASSNLSYQFNRLPSPSGIWSRWACVRGPNGIYFLGRDGIYLATEQGAVNISDAQLNSIFPHDGQAATGTDQMAPVDMNRLTDLRLSCCDYDVYFDYTDTNGAQQTFRYEIQEKRWFPHTYGDPIATHYLVEPSTTAPNAMQILLLSRTLGFVYLAGGDDDNGIPILSQILVPSFDGGDERAQKLYVDQMVDASGTGTFTATPKFNNNANGGLTVSYTVAGARQQFLTNIADIGAISSAPGNPTPGPPPVLPTTMQLFRNISVLIQWTGGPDGPQFYAWEASGYAQPMLMTEITTQLLNLSFPGWKHHRRVYPGLISFRDLDFVIRTQDGRTYGPYTIPSTNGWYRIQPFMVDADCKDLAFAYQLKGDGTPFALFPEAFTIETKEWQEPSYIELAVFKT